MGNEPFNGDFWRTNSGIIIKTWINALNSYARLNSYNSAAGGYAGELFGGVEMFVEAQHNRAILHSVVSTANNTLIANNISNFTFRGTDIVEGGLISIMELQGPVDFVPGHLSEKFVDLFNEGFVELRNSTALSATLDEYGRVQINGSQFELQSIGIHSDEFGQVSIVNQYTHDLLYIPSFEGDPTYSPLIIDGSAYQFSDFEVAINSQIESLLDDEMFQIGPVITQVDPDTGYTTELYTALDGDGDFVVREIIIKSRDQNGDPEDYIEKRWIKTESGMTWLKSQDENKKPLDVNSGEIIQEGTKFTFDGNTFRILNEIHRQDGSIEHTTETRAVKYKGEEIEELVVVGSRVMRDSDGTEIDKNVEVSVHELDIKKPYLGPREAQYISGSQIGSIFGSSIGRTLGGDDTFAQLAGSTILGAIGTNLGQLVDDSVGIRE